MGVKGARGLIPVFSKKKTSGTWKMSFEQQIPERDRNVRLYSNRGEVVVRGERRGERLADQTGKVSTWLMGRL